MSLLLPFVLSTQADAADLLARAADRFAVADAGAVRVYAATTGTILTSLPIEATRLLWNGDMLLAWTTEGVVLWTEANGMQLAGFGPQVGPGPHGLLYGWRQGVTILDPLTHSSTVLQAAGAEPESATNDGVIRNGALYGWDSRRVALRPPDADGCTVIPGPAMSCISATALLIVGGSGTREWHSPDSTKIIGFLDSGPRAGTLLVQGAAGVSLVDPGGARVASWSVPATAPQAWALNNQGVAQYDPVARSIILSNLEGRKRTTLHLAVDAPSLAIPEPVLRVRLGPIEALLSLDDGARIADTDELWRYARLPPPPSPEKRPDPRLVSTDASTWVFEPDDGASAVTIQRRASEGRLCGTLIGLVGSDGALAAYTLTGVQKWALPGAGVALAPAPDAAPYLALCRGDNWLVFGTEDWAIVSAETGEVVQHGRGESSRALLPEPPAAEYSRDDPRSWCGNCQPRDAAWKVEAILSPTGDLPAGVLASREGGFARIDGTGIRWQVELYGELPLVDEGTVYVETRGTVVALDAATGALLWASRMASGGNSSLDIVRP